ncbi:MAG: hypothetical protein HQL06_11230 [Nitrospirae bacterium]|nr:hypothetical protein [Nitrospirota bacterium]
MDVVLSRVIKGDTKHQRIVLGVIILLLVCFLRSVAHASDQYNVVVVESSGFKAYEEVLSGFMSTCNCNVKKVVTLDQNKIGAGVLDEIQSLKPKMVFAIGSSALELLSVINDIPVVYTMVHNPKPKLEEKKNIIGVTINVPYEKQLSTITKIFPKVKRIGILYNPNNAIITKSLSKAFNSAASLGITLIEGKVQNSKEVVDTVDTMDGHVEAVWLIPDMLVASPELIEYIILYSIKYKIPVFSFTDKHLDLGASLSISTLPADLGIQAGEIARLTVYEGITPNSFINEAKYATVMINKVVASKMGFVIGDNYKNKDTLRIDLTKPSGVY